MPKTSHGENSAGESELKRSRSLSNSIKTLFKSTSPSRKTNGPAEAHGGPKSGDKLMKLAKGKELELGEKRREAALPARGADTPPLASPAPAYRPHNAPGPKGVKGHILSHDFGKLSLSRHNNAANGGENSNGSQESIISEEGSVPKPDHQRKSSGKRSPNAESGTEGSDRELYDPERLEEESSIDNELSRDPNHVRRVKSLQRQKSGTSAASRSRSMSLSSRYRARSPTHTASPLDEHFESECKCVLSTEKFKLYEDGHHEHTLKVTPIVLETHDDDGKGKSMFSLSGFFKGHKEDEKLESALSLLPRANFDFRKRLSRILDEELNDSSSEPEDEQQKKVPKPVNPNAAIGTEELRLINKISRKIHDGGGKETSVEGAMAKKNYTLFQKYGKPVDIIGQGAYGVVKVCCIDISSLEDERSLDETYSNGQKLFYAVKELKPKNDEAREKFGTRLTSEFIIGHSLSQRGNSTQKAHPNILKMLDLMQTNDGFVEVLEFCPSGDLYSLLSSTSKKGLHPLEADCFMKQLLHGVQYMHDHGIAHCDLKPENILFGPNGTLKICDFGTSCVFQTAWEKQVHFQTGAVGSEPYVAPEEFIAEREYDPRLVDCWSCGVIYCTMVLGHYLWKIPLVDKDSVYRSFVEEVRANREFVAFEELKHVNAEVNRCRKLCLYAVFQWNPDKRTSIEKLLHSNWMKRTRCCVNYKTMK